MHDTQVKLVCVRVKVDVHHEKTAVSRSRRHRCNAHGGPCAVSEVDLKPHHLNRIESAHGGLIATLLDNAMVNAGRAVSGPDARLATIEMKISNMRTGKGSLRCTARCLHTTAKLAFCDAEVRDLSGKLVATASITLQYIIGSRRQA